MGTVKIKFRNSIVEGKAGTLYLQIIHERVIRQINTYCRVMKEDWDSTNSRLKLSNVMSRKDIELINNWDKVRFERKRLQQIINHKDQLLQKYSSDDIVSAYVLHHKSSTLFGYTLRNNKETKTIRKYI